MAETTFYATVAQVIVVFMLAFVWEGGFRDLQSRRLAGAMGVALGVGLLIALQGITRDLPGVFEWIELAIVFAATLWLINRIDKHYARARANDEQPSQSNCDPG